MQFIPIPGMGISRDVLAEGMKRKPMGNNMLVDVLLPQGLVGPFSKMVNALTSLSLKDVYPAQ